MVAPKVVMLLNEISPVLFDPNDFWIWMYESPKMRSAVSFATSRKSVPVPGAATGLLPGIWTFCRRIDPLLAT